LEIDMKRVLSCAVTGAAPIGKDTQVPVTPKEIADSSIGAAKAGAAVVHIHVRDPQTGNGSMELKHYRETVDRIRDSGVDVLINLTTGSGARFMPSKSDPAVAAPGSLMKTAVERTQHVVALKPDICSLDFQTMWMGNNAMINSPEMITEMAGYIRNAGVFPEYEVFDTGDVHLAKKLIHDGVLKGPGFFQIVLGAGYGASPSVETILYMKSLLPQGAKWAAFGIARMEFPMLAQTYMLGGHIRVGFEDNRYLSYGVPAPTNAALVEKAKRIVEALDGELASPKEARVLLGMDE
jgi:uncharacterized protein (DUF849 family)